MHEVEPVRSIYYSMPHPGGQARGRWATLRFLAGFVGTCVLALLTERAQGVVSRVPTEAHRAAVFTVRVGVVIRFHAYADREEALASLDS